MSMMKIISKEEAKIGDRARWSKTGNLNYGRITKFDGDYTVIKGEKNEGLFKVHNSLIFEYLRDPEAKNESKTHKLIRIPASIPASLIQEAVDSHLKVKVPDSWKNNPDSQQINRLIYHNWDIRTNKIKSREANNDKIRKRLSVGDSVWFVDEYKNVRKGTIESLKTKVSDKLISINHANSSWSVLPSQILIDSDMMINRTELEKLPFGKSLINEETDSPSKLLKTLEDLLISAEKAEKSGKGSDDYNDFKHDSHVASMSAKELSPKYKIGEIASDVDYASVSPDLGDAVYYIKRALETLKKHLAKNESNSVKTVCESSLPDSHVQAAKYIRDSLKIALDSLASYVAEASEAYDVQDKKDRISSFKAAQEILDETIKSTEDALSQLKKFRKQKLTESSRMGTVWHFQIDIDESDKTHEELKKIVEKVLDDSKLKYFDFSVSEPSDRKKKILKPGKGGAEILFSIDTEDTPSDQRKMYLDPLMKSIESALDSAGVDSYFVDYFFGFNK